MSNSTNKETPQYGVMDTSFKAAGGEAGLRKLCEDFYHLMNTLSSAKTIRDMHKEDLNVMTDKLTLFLCMWLGGPKTYSEKYQFVPMPIAHKHLIINEVERDAWLLCMDKAIDLQHYEPLFVEYLKRQLRFPAEMIRKTARSE